MAFKDKALKRLAERLNKAGIPYNVGAGWLLCVRGVTDSFHDFDVLVPFEMAQAAKAPRTQSSRSRQVPSRRGRLHYAAVLF